MVGEDNQAVEDSFEVDDVSWINKTEQTSVLVRIRHGGELIPAKVEKVENGLKITLAKAVRGVASGQSAVFYTKDGECLGGGVIV